MSEGPLCFIMPLICSHLTAITTERGRGFRHMENWAFTFFADPLVFSPFVFQARMHEGSPSKIILSVYRSCFLLEMPKNNEGKLEIDSFYFILFLIFSNYLTNEEKEHITQSFLSIDSLLLFISFKLISLNSSLYLYIYS